MKEKKNAAKEAFNGAALAQFLSRPGGRQTGAVFLTFGVPRNDGHRTQDTVNPANETQTPIGGIQTDHARMNAIQMHRPCQEWLSKGSIMNVRRRDKEKERQARTTANQGMDPITAEKWARMLGWGMRHPAASGSARHQARMGTLSIMRSRAPMSRRRRALRTVRTKSASGSGASARFPCFHCCEGEGTRGRPSRPRGKPHARAGQSRN